MTVTRTTREPMNRNPVRASIACHLIIPAVYLLCLLAPTMASAQDADTWWHRLATELRTQPAMLAAFTGETAGEFKRVFGLAGKDGDRIESLSRVARIALERRLTAYRGSANLLQAYCLSLLMRDRPDLAARTVRDADTASPWMPWLAMAYGARADFSDRPELADLWYAKALAGLAREGIRMDISWPIICSPVLWLGMAARHHAERGDQARVDCLYEWMNRMGMNVEGMEIVHLKAAASFQSRGDLERAAVARQRAQRMFDDPNVLFPRRHIVAIDLGLVVGFGALCLLLMLLGSLGIKYWRCGRLHADSLAQSAPWWSRLLRSITRPWWSLASRGELAAVVMATLLTSAGFGTAAAEISTIARVDAAPLSLLGGHWAEPELGPYLDAAARTGREPATTAYLQAYHRLASGRLDQAIAQLRNLVGDGGPLASDGEAWLNLGTALARLGRTGEARQAWQQAADLGCRWAVVNLGGPIPAPVRGQEAIESLARAAHPGSLLIPPGPERIARVVRGVGSFFSATSIEFVASVLAEVVRMKPEPEALALFLLVNVWLLGVAILGMARRSRVRRCACGQMFLATIPSQRTCGGCPQVGKEGDVFDDEEFLVGPAQPLPRYLSRHLLALAVPGIKPTLRGAPATGFVLMGMFLGGLVAREMLALAYSHGYAGIGVFSSMVTPNMFSPMYGSGYSVTLEPFGSLYIHIVGWMIPMAYLLNAVWLLREWRRGTIDGQ